MESVAYRAVLRLVKLLNVALMTALAVTAWCLCYADGLWSQTGLLMAAIFCVLYMTYGRIYESFLISLVRITEMVYSQALALLMSDGILYLVLSLMAHRLVNPMGVLCLFGVQLLVSVIWCVCAHKWYFASFAPKRTAVIHDRGRDVGELIGTYGLSKKFEVCRTATLEECLEGNFEVLEGMQTVFLELVRHGFDVGGIGNVEFRNFRQTDHRMVDTQLLAQLPLDTGFTEEIIR